MEIIGDNTTVTSIIPKYKVVQCHGERYKYWLELQFVDENNSPVSGLNVWLEYRPLASAEDVAMWRWSGYDFNPTPPPNPPAGVTDSQGLVRFNDLHWITVDVKTDAQSLADEMAQRPLGLRRNPNSQPVSNNIFKPETRDPTWRSDVQEKAEAAGHPHHYVTIGELCDRLPQIEGWDEPELAGAGNIHGGFLEAYELAKRKFEPIFQQIKTSIYEAKGTKKLFICGHSLGGSLALLYAAEMKDSQPVLYTYGMPRTFTRAAMSSLDSITHYRHVNDNDTVPQVPLETDMDNLFYQTLGPLGDKLGFNWLATSVAGLPVSLWQKDMELKMGLRLKKDPYWHHGNTVVFFRAQQCSMKLASPNRKSLVDGEVYARNFVSIKLFLVPSLNDECLTSTGEHQAAFIQCLNPVSLEKAFPKNTNPTLDGLGTDPRSHSMAHRYLPYIHNQVLELANPTLPMRRKEMRERFIREIDVGASGQGNPDEVQRNRQFIELQNMLPVALHRTQAEETGKNALLRFTAVTEEEVEFSI